MTHVVKIDIISGHMEIGLFAFSSEHYFYCMFIEKPCIFSKLVQLTMSVKHIFSRNFIKKIYFYSHEINEGDNL